MIKIFRENKSVKHLKFAGIIFLFGIFLALRLYHLGYHDFWYDEVGTVATASSRYYWDNWNAPLHYILMHFWVKLCGLSEFSSRFPSLIFSFSSVILTYLLGKTLFNTKVAVLASFLIGLSPFHLWYAQEARDYSMVLFLGTAASYLLLQALKSGKPMGWLFFVLVSALGFYTSYFYIFLFLAQSLYVLSVKRTRLGFKETVCLLIIAVGFLPQLPKFLDKFHTVWQGFWILKPQGRSLIITIENFILGYNGTPVLYMISDVLAGIFFVLALWAVRLKEFRRPFLFCACLLFVPVIAAFFFSRIFFSVYIDRGLILFSPYGYLLLSLGAASLRRVPRFFLFGILIFVMLLGDYRFVKDLMVQPFEHHMGTYIKRPIKPVAKFLRDNIILEEDEVAFTNVSTMPGIHFYGGSLDDNRVYSGAVRKKEFVNFYYFFDPKLLETTWKEPQRENRYFLSLNKIEQLQFIRLWVIASDWARSGGFDENSRSVKAWLDKNFKLEFAKEIEGLWIFRYVRDGSGRNVPGSKSF